MPSKLKFYMSNEYKERFKNVNAMLFFDYQGIGVNDWHNLKDNLQKQDIQIMVIRNNVFVKTLNERNIGGLGEILAGPIAVAYGKDEGAVINAAKELTKYFKKTKKGKIKGGILDGSVDDESTADKYRDLLTREEILSVISGQLLALGSKLSASILGAGAKLASQIEKKSKE